MRAAERSFWIAGGLGLAFALLGWIVSPRDFAFAWLACLASWLGWPLGSLALLMVHELTGGRWGEALRPALRFGVLTLPLLLPALLPLLLTAPYLYPWLHADIAAGLENRWWLDPGFAASRLGIYLVLWLGIAGLVLRGARVAVPGLILLGFSFSFACIDLTMSLDPHFKSSAYGMIAGAAAALFALSIAVLIAHAGDSARADLGRLLLGLTVLWAYLDFVQLLIVWQSDLADEAPWYIARAAGIWGSVAGLVALGHFVLPFFVLLAPARQSRRRVVLGVAALLAVMEILRGWWLVLPGEPRAPGWIDLACLLAFAGLGFAIACRLRAWPARRALRHV